MKKNLCFGFLVAFELHHKGGFWKFWLTLPGLGPNH